MSIRPVLIVSALTLAACGPSGPPAERAAPEPAPVDPPISSRPPSDLPPPRRATAAATQCEQGETHLYSCPMEDGRIVSVCVGARQVAYRYGPEEAPEIDLVVPAGQPGLWAGGQSQPHLRFRTGAHDYVVYSGRQADDVERSGVLVLRDGREISRLACPVTSSQTEIPAGMVPDYVLREPAGRRADDWF